MSVLRIEVVYALRGRQLMRSVSLPEGSTVEQALRASGLVTECPGIDLTRVGVFGKIVSKNTLLRDRDRVEVYRPLEADPKEVRRRRAERKRPRG